MPQRLTDPRLIPFNEWEARRPQRVQQQLPVFNPVGVEHLNQYYLNPSLSDLGRVYDYAFQAPVRAGMQATAEGKGVLGTLGAMGRQYFRKPETAPSRS